MVEGWWGTASSPLFKFAGAVASPAWCVDDGDLDVVVHVAVVAEEADGEEEEEEEEVTTWPSESGLESRDTLVTVADMLSIERASVYSFASHLPFVAASSILPWRALAKHLNISFAIASPHAPYLPVPGSCRLLFYPS